MQIMTTNDYLRMLKRGVGVWNEWVKEHLDVIANLSESDLRGLDLRGAYLTRADLSFADLSDAIVADVDLRGADLSGADLSGAVLTSSKLKFANLSVANLIDADLTGADLTRAQFNGTDLSGPNVDRATLSGPVLAGVNLSSVENVDTTIHMGPSEISISTIYLSEGNISSEFLRRCGVPESFIGQLSTIALTMRPSLFYSCFISYSHTDKIFATKLYNALQDRDIRCWL